MYDKPSSSQNVICKQQALAAGAQGYLVKPVDHDELIAEVSRIISEAKRRA
jgi:YesN/AraC family two-component response regulator